MWKRPRRSPGAWPRPERPRPTRPASASACAWRGSPRNAEVERLVQLYDDAHAEYAKAKDKAVQLATNPLGPVPAGADAIDLAAWTTVANVLLNLDETLMKR